MRRFVARSMKTNQLSGLIAISPEGTAENSPGCQSWVNWTTRECYWRSSKANTILSENTDCIQSTDYLYTKRDLLVWTALAENRRPYGTQVGVSSSHADSSALVRTPTSLHRQRRLGAPFKPGFGLSGIPP